MEESKGPSPSHLLDPNPDPAYQRRATDIIEKKGGVVVTTKTRKGKTAIVPLMSDQQSTQLNNGA